MEEKCSHCNQVCVAGSFLRPGVSAGSDESSLAHRVGRVPARLLTSNLLFILRPTSDDEEQCPQTRENIFNRQ